MLQVVPSGTRHQVVVDSAADARHPREIPKAPTPATVTARDGTNLALDSRGTGPGILILTGVIAPPDSYRALAKALSRRFTVHILHRRSRGASGPQGFDYSLDVEVADVRAALLASGARIVFGHSYGGLIAVRAAMEPDAAQIMDCLLAYEPVVPVVGVLPTDFVQPFKDAVEQGHLARAQAIFTRGLSVGGVMERIPFRAEVALYWVMRWTMMRDVSRTVPAAVAEIEAARSVEGAADAYQRISVPGRVFVGDKSPEWLRDSARLATEQMPKVTLTMTTGLDHNAPLLASKRVAQLITDSFLLEADQPQPTNDFNGRSM